MIRASMMIAGVATTSALVVGAPTMHASRVSTPMMATIGDQLSTMDGADLYWEEKGPLQNPPLEESDFKEYDKFSTFVAACQQHGIDLSQPDITVFAPGDKACAEYSAVNGPLTKEVCAALASPPRSSYKGDIKADNGLIHGINEVIY